MKKRSKQKPSDRFTINAISELTGIDRRTLAKRLADAKTIGDDEGQKLYSATDALKATRGQSQAATRPELAMVKLEREQNKNRKEKVEADAAEGIVIPKLEAQRALTRFVAGLVHRLLPIPLRASQRLSLETEPRAIEALLLKEIREAIAGADEFKFGLLPCLKCKSQIQI